MSDPMSHTEIEDVLSSIRRLVTEDHRPAQTADAHPAGKLVLTPAHRIADDPQDQVRPAATTEPPLRLVSPQPPAFEAQPSHRAAAALEAAVSRRGEDWEAEDPGPTRLGDWTTEWNAADEADLTDGRVPEQTVADIPSAPPPADGPGDDVWDSFLAEHRTAPLVAAERAAQPWSPPPVPATPGRSAAAPAMQPGLGHAPDDAPPPLSPLPVTSSPDQAAQHTAQDDMAGQGGPDSASPVKAEPEGAPVEPELLDPQPDLASTGTAPAQAVGTTPVRHGNDDPASPDDEVLRDLIRQVLREELQGPFGDRVTHAVRKLVRAEIARALTLRDLS